MNISYYRTDIGPSSRLLIAGFVLLTLSGCEQTPKPEPSDGTALLSDAKAVSDDQATGGQSIAESGPPAELALKNESPKIAVDVSAFWNAALEGKIEVVRQAIEAGVDVNAEDDQQRTALMLASFNGHTAVVKLLRKHDASLIQRDAVGRTALMFAATGANAETVKYLLDAGADVNAVDATEGFTALMHAAAEGQLEVVQILLKHKADAAIRDVDGDTARDFAERNGHAEVVRLLSN